MSTPLPETPRSSPPPADALARQIRLLKTLVVLLLLALAAGAGYLLYVRHAGQPVAVTLDGKAVATVRSAAWANHVLEAAERAKVGPSYPAGSLVRLQRIQLLPVPPGTPLDTDAAAQAKLRAALKLHVRAYAILVNGKLSIGLPTNAAAVETLTRVKEHFARMPPAAEIVGEPKFVEAVDIRPASIDSARARPSAAAAAPYFWTPPPSKTYVVKNGDRGEAIARRSHISLTDLILANPGRNLNKLRIGDVLNVQKMPLLLTVRVRKRFTQDEPIIAHAPAADAGRRQVTYVVTYTDGQETKRDVLNMVTLEKPRTRSEL